MGLEADESYRNDTGECQAKGRQLPTSGTRGMKMTVRDAHFERATVALTFLCRLAGCEAWRLDVARLEILRSGAPKYFRVTLGSKISPQGNGIFLVMDSV